MGQVPSDIKKSIEHAIREGVGQEYLGIVKELKNAYYLEDVAAAAIALYAKQGGQQEERVRRRTLDSLTPVPHKVPEAKVTGERKKPIQPPVRPREHNIHLDTCTKGTPRHQRAEQANRTAGAGDKQTGQPGQPAEAKGPARAEQADRTTGAEQTGRTARKNQRR